MAGITVKKKTYKDSEHPIYDGEAVLYLVKDTWYFRCWLAGENKYARKSLRTKSLEMAIERGKSAFHKLQADLDAGRKYFAIDIKQAVELYLADKQEEVVGFEDRGLRKGIVEQRFDNIKIHLKHFLNYIHRDTKCSELRDGDLKGYVAYRHKQRKGIKDSTIRNEIASINACMKWIYDEQKQADFRECLKPTKQLNATSNEVDNDKIER